MSVQFGDNVRVRESEETVEAGVSGRVGNVSGVTTPSVTGIQVIGRLEQDLAFHVLFDDSDEGCWFAPELLELIDHAPGLVFSVGNLRAVRRPDGTWEETVLSPKKRWWQFWRRSM